jgi:hypothetical protein
MIPFAHTATNPIYRRCYMHYAICLATRLAILLQHKLHTKLQGVSCLAINKSRNIFVATTIARSRIRFYFPQRLWQRCNAFVKHCTSVTSLLQLVSQCLYTEWLHGWLLTDYMARNVSTCAFYTIFNNDHCKLHATYRLV